MSVSRLTKPLYTDITRLKLLDTNSAKHRFRVLKTPFSGDEGGDLTSQNREEYTIAGLIFPNSDIYKERAYKIEIILPTTYPVVPPGVRFLTPIYHPNVDTDGKFSNELLLTTAQWLPTTSLVKVIEIVTEHIDKPNIDYSIRTNVGREYQEDPEQFKRNALQNVQKHGLPRDQNA